MCKKIIDATTLTAELTALGLYFVVGEAEPSLPTRLTPAEFIAGLVQQSDARLRMALIALFLYRPDLETAVSPALAKLSANMQTQLKIYYPASVLLQRIHESRLKQLAPLWQRLPDYFSDSFGLNETDPPILRLQGLSRQHREISGIVANWFGTYQHAANRLLMRLKKEATWTI